MAVRAFYDVYAPGETCICIGNIKTVKPGWRDLRMIRFFQDPIGRINLNDHFTAVETAARKPEPF